MAFELSLCLVYTERKESLLKLKQQQNSSRTKYYILETNVTLSDNIYFG